MSTDPEHVLDGTVDDVKNQLPEYDGDLKALLEQEEQGKNRKTAKQAIKAEMQRRTDTDTEAVGEADAPQGIPTPDFSGGVELPDLSRKDLFVVGGILAALLLIPYFAYDTATLDSTDDVYTWLQENAEKGSGEWCTNFTKTFEESNTTLQQQGGSCECFDASGIPERSIPVERLVRETADLKAVVVCELNGQQQIVPYWEAPRGDGVQTTE